MTFGILGNTGKPAIREILTELFAYCRKKEISYVVHDALGAWLNHVQGTVPAGLLVPESDLPGRCGMIISFGGDGTMLATARAIGASGVPILGVNIGKLGFLAEVSVDQLYASIDDVAKGNFHIEERMTLEATVSTAPERKYTALNDIVIDRGSSPRVIDLEISVNDDFLVTHAADGIILATPTGSTAYSLAAGGPIVEPHSSVVIINPISPHTLSARPVIVSGESVIRVAVSDGTNPIHITGDGQFGDFFPPPVEFTVRRGQYNIRLVKLKKRTYFDLLRTKLLWGRDIRMEKWRNEEMKK
jgi:NAD+ kinase